MRVLEGHTDDVMALAFAPDGGRLVSAGWDGTVRVWDPLEGQTVRCIRTANDHATTVAVSPDGQYLAAGFRHKNAPGSYNRGYGTVAWFPATPRPGEHPDTISPGDTWFAHEPGVRSVAFFPTGRILATLGVDFSGGPNLVFWDLAQRKAVVRISTTFNPMQAIAFQPDGQALAAISSVMGEGLFLWDLTVGPDGPRAYARKPRLLRYPNDRGWALAFSPDAQALVGAFDSGRLVWWQPDSYNDPVIRRAHNGAAQGVCFSPDGRLLLSAGNDGLIHLWDNSTRTRRTTYDWQLGDVHCLAFAPDGLTAVAGGNGPILLWDVDH